MTGMLDTDAPSMEAAGGECATDPTAADWTAGQVPPANQESHEYEAMQQQLYSMKHIKSEAENIDQADPTVDLGQVIPQPPESNCQDPSQSSEPNAVKEEAGDSESPSNMELEDAPKEEGAEEVTGAASEQEPGLPSEYDRLWKAVEDNPEDFNGWVYLLQYVEQEVSALTSY